MMKAERQASKAAKKLIKSWVNPQEMRTIDPIYMKQQVKE